ncbi:ATP-binding protein [Denitromonas halophila]|uniref:histidine kinase n=1 Tax=Denitromonas halophila TaxID=1629404 RepID=A0A557R038_9RHOO|nr:ATP-binding protein [Denitromonas halophila]TVO58521.1 histidine kinase [Denitromonas halophila]
MPENTGGPKVATERSAQDEIVRQQKIIQALMNRIEREANGQRSDFVQFQTNVILENQVRARTAELEAAVVENREINQSLVAARLKMTQEIEERKRVQAALEKEKDEQRALIQKLESAQNQLLQSEQLASIGQLAAGLAHEINNPIGFVNSNLSTLQTYAADLLRLIAVYERYTARREPDPAALAEVEAVRQAIDIDYLREDIASLIAESIDGAVRVHRIVQDMRDFSLAGDDRWQLADLHHGLDSTLNIVWGEIKDRAQIVKAFGELPEVECLPCQINQVFMNLLMNAAQACEGGGTITLSSGADGEWVWIDVADTGCGIAAEHLTKIFDPFFTTKPVGQGTGLGLSVSYGIAKRHGGCLEVESHPGRGTRFRLCLPARQRTATEDHHTACGCPTVGEQTAFDA